MELYRSRWYGWQRRGASGLQTKHDSGYVNTNAASPQCGGERHDWEGRSYHESVEIVGTYYGGTYSRQNELTC
jgi:hypothetical protein